MPKTSTPKSSQDTASPAAPTRLAAARAPPRATPRRPSPRAASRLHGAEACPAYQHRRRLRTPVCTGIDMRVHVRTCLSYSQVVLSRPSLHAGSPITARRDCGRVVHRLPQARRARPSGLHRARIVRAGERTPAGRGCGQRPRMARLPGDAPCRSPGRRPTNAIEPTALAARGQQANPQDHIPSPAETRQAETRQAEARQETPHETQHGQIGGSPPACGPTRTNQTAVRLSPSLLRVRPLLCVPAMPDGTLVRSGRVGAPPHQPSPPNSAATNRTSSAWVYSAMPITAAATPRSATARISSMVTIPPAA
jgi:hypothetical protein